MYFSGFLYLLSTFSDVNMMTPQNIGIVVGPNLLWIEPFHLPVMELNAVVALLVAWYPVMFPKEGEEWMKRKPTISGGKSGEPAAQNPGASRSVESEPGAGRPLPARPVLAGGAGGRLPPPGRPLPVRRVLPEFPGRAELRVSSGNVGAPGRSASLARPPPSRQLSGAQLSLSPNVLAAALSNQTPPNSGPPSKPPPPSPREPVAQILAAPVVPPRDDNSLTPREDSATKKEITQTNNSPTSTNEPSGNSLDQKNAAPNLDNDIATWSVDSVCEWLESEGFSQYVDTFKDNDIDGGILMSLTPDEMLSSLGIKSLGHRRRLDLD